MLPGDIYGHLNLWNGARQRIDDPEHHWLRKRPFSSTLVAHEATKVLLLDRRQFSNLLRHKKSEFGEHEVLELCAVPSLERKTKHLADFHRWCLEFIGFYQLPDSVLCRLVEVMTAITLPPNKIVYNKASELDGIYFVVSGGVKIHDSTLPERIVRVGDFFGSDDIHTKHRHQEIATTIAPTILLRVPKTHYLYFMYPIYTVEQPASLLSQCPMGRRATRQLLHEISYLLHNLHIFNHIPLALCMECIPFLRVKTFSSGDTISLEDSFGDALFSSIVKGRVAGYSRDHWDKCYEAIDLHPFSFVPSLHDHQLVSPIEKQYTTLYGRYIHTFHSTETFRTQAIDANGQHFTPMTLVAIEPTMAIELMEADVQGIIQRLADPTMSCWALRAAVDGGTPTNSGVIHSNDELATIAQELWFTVKEKCSMAHELFEIVHYKPGDKIICSGERLNYLTLILRGQCTVTRAHIRATQKLHNHNQDTSSTTTPIRQLRSDFKSTSKTLLCHEKRSKSVLPTLLKLSKRPARLRLNSVVPHSIDCPPIIVASVDKPQHDIIVEDGVLTIQTCWTIKAGDLYGGEIALPGAYKSLYSVTTDTPVQILKCSKEAFERIQTIRRSNHFHEIAAPSKRIMAKAHWMRANYKVVETIVAHPSPIKQPRFWNLLDQAVSQRVKLIIKHLAHMSLFECMSEETMSNIVSSAKFDTIDKGTIIYTAGDSPKKYYVVVTGKVYLYSPLPQLEHQTLKRLGHGEGFGEFEILTSQTTRNLTAVAQETTQLISFTTQTFTDLWDKNVLSNMRDTIAFFLNLSWTSRLELDRLCHLIYAARSMIYTKDAEIFSTHSKLNHAYIISQGTCSVQATLRMELTEKEPNDPISNDPLIIHSNLAHVSSGHTIWACGECYFSLTSITTDTKVLTINYDTLRAIVPKWVQSDLDRDIQEQNKYHRQRIQDLKGQAMEILNMRSRVTSVVNPVEEAYFTPPLKTQSQVLQSRPNHLTMTDIVAGQPVAFNDILYVSSSLTTENTTSSTAIPSILFPPQEKTIAPKHGLGSFYASRNVPMLNYTSDSILLEDSNRFLATTPIKTATPPRPWRCHATPIEKPVINTTISTKSSPFRLFRLKPIPIESQERGSNQTEQSPLASIALLGNGLNSLPCNTPRTTTPRVKSHEAITKSGNNQIKLSKLNHNGGSTMTPLPELTQRKAKIGILSFRGCHKCTAVFQNHILTCYTDEHDIARPEVALGIWRISATTDVIDYPPEALNPMEFNIIIDGETTNFSALTLQDKLRWLSTLRQSIAQQRGSGISIASNRVMPAPKKSIVKTEPSEESALPALEYIVAFPPS
ncbi:hypothetical protein THRCLA_03471 [Thraustotheca clavata]|uniref:Cyclic nucleotide-binding domain-containing protein n=1 Tax=Thraustotheca clavata TaxID=74557 RepID=A0A1W0A2L6_9STRA|nr:hypothetical protein THRCLA_03471 [Thraustotheca clavata]